MDKLRALVSRAKAPRFYYGAGEVSNALTLILFAILARLLGVELYGDFIALTAFATIGGELIQLGFPSLITRSVARRPELAWLESARALFYQSLVSLPLLGLLYLYMVVGGYEAELYGPGLLIGASICIRSLKTTLRGACRGLEQFDVEALFLWTERATLLLFSVIAVLLDGGLLGLACVFFGVRLVDFVAFYFVMKSRYEFTTDPPQITRLSWSSLFSFAVSGVMWSMYYQVDTAMLPLLSDSYNAGIYGALYRIVDLVQVAPRLILVVSFPVLSSLWVTDRSAYSPMVHSLRRVITFASLPVLGCVLILDTHVLSLLFGGDYAIGEKALGLLVLGMYFAFHSMLLGQTLKASGKESQLAGALSASVVANICLNIVLIPRLGFMGASISTLATEVVHFFMVRLCVARSSLLQDTYVRGKEVSILCVLITLVVVPVSTNIISIGSGLAAVVLLSLILKPGAWNITAMPRKTT